MMMVFTHPLIEIKINRKQIYAYLDTDIINFKIIYERKKNHSTE